MKKTNFTFSHSLLNVRAKKATKTIGLVVSFLALFVIIGFQGLTAQTPIELGESLTDDVIQEFNDEISDLEQDAQAQQDRHLKNLSQYLSVVRDEFDDGMDLGQAFRANVKYIFAKQDSQSETNVKNASVGVTASSSANETAENYRELLQMTEDIQLSDGNLSDLTEIFDFLRTL